ncbi:uncharacterized protein LOC111136771 isoform X2 [Crassostrea virginica]
MPSSEPTECMYHGDRAGFAVLTRELKRNRVLPKPYLTRLASAVCSCRKCKTDINQMLRETDLGHMIKHLEEEELPRLSASLVNYLLRIIRKTPFEQYCETKLLYIVYKALAERSYDELTYNAINSRPKPLPPVAAVKNPGRISMSKKQFNCMQNKKLRKKDSVRHVILPLFARNVLKLKQSHDYQRLREEFAPDGLFVSFCEKENTNFINSNQTKTAVQLYLKNVGRFSSLVAKLKQVAENLQTERDDQLRTRKQMCLERNVEPHHDNQTITEFALDLKESSGSQFGKKKSTKRKHKKPLILSGGHCLNCLAPFVDIHTKERECRHHPGFLVYPKQVWSCCKRKSKELKADYAVHSQTGCRTSQHNWRPHKKHQPRVGRNLFYNGDHEV